MTTATGDVAYLVLADRASAYLLARVRWPDVAQAITIGSPDWLDDPGLFDLPYDPSAMAVTFPQAASVAAAWGRQLRPEPDASAPSFIRRMTANWSDLSPAERRALGIARVGKRRSSAHSIRRLSRLRSSQPKNPSPALRNGYAGGPAGGHDYATGVATTGHESRPVEPRQDVRIRVDGRALIRTGDTTISAGLVDLSEAGMECVLPEARPMIAREARLSGPFLLESQGTTTQICLDVAGRISWHWSTGTITYLGVAFDDLSDAQTDGVRRFLASAVRRGSR